MTEKKIRLSRVVKELNISSGAIVEFLLKNKFEIENNPNTKISEEQYYSIKKEFSDREYEKKENSQDSKTKTSANIEKSFKNIEKKKIDIPILEGATILGSEKIEGLYKIPKKISSVKEKNASKEEAKKKITKKNIPSSERINSKPEENIGKKVFLKKDISTIKKLSEEPLESTSYTKNKKSAPILEKINVNNFKKLQGIKIIDNDDLLPNFGYERIKKKVPLESKVNIEPQKESPIKGEKLSFGFYKKKENKNQDIKKEENREDIKKRLKKIESTFTPTGKKTSRSKYKKQKRLNQAEFIESEKKRELQEKKIIKILEYSSINEISALIGKSVTEIMQLCISLGVMCTFGQRLDRDTIELILSNYDLEANFVDSFEDSDNHVDLENKMLERPPIVTVMGHVDHGKTSLLDYIQNREIAKKESGGITQHIGAYSTKTKSGKIISFLDTPGHEAFTAMRSRGVKITDIVIIVVAADDGVMMQTKEAISHAKSSGVSIIVAINKIDKPGINIDKVKEELSNEGILVEDWGGKYQCQAISAKTGEGVEELLDKIILEADLLELKSNPDRPARGIVIESYMKKGKGYISYVMIQKGTLKVGDIITVGAYYGKVKALNNHLGEKIKAAGPSTPVEVLGINGGIPQSGETLIVMSSEREAKEFTNRKQFILREQNSKVQKQVSLDDMNRKLFEESIEEFNCIIKGDVDGSVEALSDSLEKLSTEKIKINIISKGIGSISESDVSLASTSGATIVGFHVKPNSSAKSLAEKENVKIVLSSIIYDAINSIKESLEKKISPIVKETVIAQAEILEIFTISKVGKIAGCLVTSGKIKKTAKVKVLRDGGEVFSGKIKYLKRFKDDVKEVKQGAECGLGIDKFYDIKKGDTLEIFEVSEIKISL